MMFKESASKPKGRLGASQSQTSGRIGLSILLFALVCTLAIGRLAQFGMMSLETTGAISRNTSIIASRPDLHDRHGEVLATDIRTVSLYAEPDKVIDPDEVIEQLALVLPDLDVKDTYRKLASKSQFRWLKRQLTPGQQSEILALGIPGIGFRPEKRRFYPGGPTVSHIVGHVNIDNVGIAGMEKYVDSFGLDVLKDIGMVEENSLAPVKLSVDLRVQHILRDELHAAKERYRAIATAGVILDIHTGEVLAMASLPDYDPNNPIDALQKDRLNRMTAGTFEMGSTFKAFTTAMALDSGQVSINDSFDATKPIRIGGFTISDFHGKKRVLSVPEIFIYSSNIGTAKMADAVGVDGHQAFLQRLGLLTRMQTELPEVASPTQPREWKKINSVTISYGHGMATTPLQTAVAAATLMNGGKYIPPTFMPRSRAEADQMAQQILKPETSRHMRDLMRENVLRGSGRRAEVNGYWVGGKTGTAEKVINGRYSSDVRFNAFLAAFPVYDPKYVVLVIIDEPKPEEGKRYATAGMNAAPTVGAVIRRSASLLGILPKFGANGDRLVESY